MAHVRNCSDGWSCSPTRTVWDEYMLRSYRPQDWFMRDIIHANNRGKHVLGRILARYFEPKP